MSDAMCSFIYVLLTAVHPFYKCTKLFMLITLGGVMICMFLPILCIGRRVMRMHVWLICIICCQFLWRMSSRSNCNFIHDARCWEVKFLAPISSFCECYGLWVVFYCPVSCSHRLTNFTRNSSFFKELLCSFKLSDRTYHEFTDHIIICPWETVWKQALTLTR
jgi:hypothetical protein